MAWLSKAFDAAFVSRPVLWIPVWGFAAFGYWRGRGGSGIGDIVRAGRSARWDVFGWVLCFSASVGAVYALNQIADRDADRGNGGFALLAHGGLPRRLAYGAAAVLAAVSVFLPLTSRPTISILAVCALALGIVYSFPPCRFSGRPVLDFISNAVGYAVIAFGVGWSLSGRALLTPSFVSSSLPYFLLMCGGSISSTLPDIPGDTGDGKRTTAVVVGERGGRLIATAFMIAAALVAYWLRDAAALASLVVAIPLYLAHSCGGGQRLMEATYKVGGGAAMLVAGLLLPSMIPAALAVFLFTKLYFRVRFGVSYPSLVPDSHGEVHA